MRRLANGSLREVAAHGRERSVEARPFEVERLVELLGHPHDDIDRNLALEVARRVLGDLRAGAPAVEHRDDAVEWERQRRPHLGHRLVVLEHDDRPPLRIAVHDGIDGAERGARMSVDHA